MFFSPPLFSTDCLSKSPAYNNTHRALPWDHTAIPAFVSSSCGWATLAGVPRCLWHRGAIFGVFWPCHSAMGFQLGYSHSWVNFSIWECTEDGFLCFPPFVTPAPLDYSTVRPLFSLLCGPGDFRHPPWVPLATMIDSLQNPLQRQVNLAGLWHG